MDGSSSLPEDQIVELWKMEQLSRLGFDGMQISNLLSWGTDTHEAENLISRGCPPELALRILMPDGAEIDTGVALGVA